LETPLTPKEAVAQILEAVGIDPVTRRAISPDPPSDPPGPLAVCVEPWQPFFDGFVERVSRIAGADLVEVIEDDDPRLLPTPCFGVIGLEAWEIQLASVARGLEVRMFETMQSLSIDDSNGIDRSWPGYRLIAPDDDWRALVDTAAWEVVRARDEFSQRYVLSMRSPSDTGRPTVWSRRMSGQSGLDYTFEKVLGLGGTAIVALVRDSSGEPHAAKTLSAHRLPVHNRQDRFEREGAILAELDHPNVVAVTDFATMDEDVPVLVMEYVDGGSVHRSLRKSGRPRLETALRWLRDALRGVAEMHRNGIVHRDLSAKNLLLRPNGQLVVGDFGTVRHLDDATLTASVDRIGSLVYMAPEQFLEPHGVGLTADVYSLGQIGFQLLTGLVPLGNTGPSSQHNPQVPTSVSNLIEEMRSYEAKDRPPDAVEALALFERRCAGLL
jgi:hypothetical protein